MRPWLVAKACLGLGPFLIRRGTLPARAAALPESVVNETPWDVPDELWDSCARVRDEVLVPALRAGRVGRLADLEIEKAIPYYKYKPHHEFLSLVDQGDNALRAAVFQTDYFRDQVSKHGVLIAALKAYAYRQLFYLIRNQGLRFDLDQCRGLPFFFCAKDLYFRLDGTHRSSVARYLGYRKIPVIVVTPKDALDLPELVGDLRQTLTELDEPTSDAFEEVRVTVTQQDVRHLLRQHRDWYQDIEFGPTLKTYAYHNRRFGRLRQLRRDLRPSYKNWAVMSALPDLTNRRVLDIGCNSGLYTCYAAMRGAKHVLGVDLDERKLAQARTVSEVFRGQGRLTGIVEFEQMNIMERLEYLEEFDAILACCVLYHLGPVGELKRWLRRSGIELLVVQCNTKRGRSIGRKNRSGEAGYEEGTKTWGNILGTVDGVRAFFQDSGFREETITFARHQHPVLVGRRISA